MIMLRKIKSYKVQVRIVDKCLVRWREFTSFVVSAISNIVVTSVLAISISAQAADPTTTTRLTVVGADKGYHITEEVVPFCGNGTDNFCVVEPSSLNAGSLKDKLFTDITATLPVLTGNGVTPIKVAVARYKLDLGGSSIPFNLYSSNAVSTTNPSDANATNMLDPQQGVVNLGFEKMIQFRLGRALCDFDSASGGLCLIDITAGARSLKLASLNPSGTAGNTNTSGAMTNVRGFGYYGQIQLVALFPIHLLDKSDDPDAGKLGVKLGYAHFRQNSSERNLFPDAVDSQGKPLLIGKNYGAYSAIIHLNITGKLNFEAAYYASTRGSRGPLKPQTVITASYNL